MYKISSVFGFTDFVLDADLFISAEIVRIEGVHLLYLSFVNK